ncbi:MAG: hypothetical protein K940chlam7_01650 [Chlamydiae bacterium]|nr:hypothetical protein [Chlamydiota bacterium]
MRVSYTRIGEKTMNSHVVFPNTSYVQGYNQQSSTSEEKHINSLPEEMLLKILTQLDMSDLPKTHLVCKSWCKLSKKPIVWNAVANRLNLYTDENTISIEKVLNHIKCLRALVNSYSEMTKPDLIQTILNKPLIQATETDIVTLHEYTQIRDNLIVYHLMSIQNLNRTFIPNLQTFDNIEAMRNFETSEVLPRLSYLEIVTSLSLGSVQLRTLPETFMQLSALQKNGVRHDTMTLRNPPLPRMTPFFQHGNESYKIYTPDGRGAFFRNNNTFKGFIERRYE